MLATLTASPFTLQHNTNISPVQCVDQTQPARGPSPSSSEDVGDVCCAAPRVKRPRNCFMVFSQQRRSEFQIRKLNPRANHAVISRALGQEWNAMSAEEKQPYERAAGEEKENHSRQNPGYKYRPRRKSHSLATARPASIPSVRLTPMASVWPAQGPSFVPAAACGGTSLCRVSSVDSMHSDTSCDAVLPDWSYFDAPLLPGDLMSDLSIAPSAAHSIPPYVPSHTAAPSHAFAPSHALPSHSASAWGTTDTSMACDGLPSFDMLSAIDMAAVLALPPFDCAASAAFSPLELGALPELSFDELFSN